MLISFQDAFWTDLGRSWPPKVPKMTPTWRPKTTQNRAKIYSKNDQNFDRTKRRPGGAFWTRPAECATPKEGLYGGPKTPPKKICSKMQKIIAKILASLATSAIASRDLTRRSPRPSGAGGGLPPPRGTTAARPSLFYCPWGLTCFVFVDLCDSCNIDMHNRLWDSVLFESFGAILEGLEPS